MSNVYSKGVIGISVVDHKQSALYFDRIFPCTQYGSVPDILKLNFRLLEDNYVKYADEYYYPGKNEFEEFVHNIKFTDWEDDTLWVANDCAFSAYDALMRKSIIAVPLFYPDPDGGIGRLFSRIHNDVGILEAIEVNLVDMKIVDTSTVPWEQIIEVKQDNQAAKKLRNFRLFAYENFQGRPINYISDRIDQKIDEYEQACKKHGLGLISSSVSMLLDSKSLLGLSAIAMVSAYIGKLEIASLAAISGAAVETSKITMNILTRKHDLSVYKDNHELAYLVHLKQRLV